MALSLLIACLLPAGALAKDDPLFGDLPAQLERLDLIRNQKAFGSLIRAIQNRIASESSISGISPGGFSFEVGPLGLPTKTSSTLGTIWTNGAEPVGHRRLSVGASYTYLDYETFNGRSLDRFFDVSRDISPDVDINLDLTTQIVWLSALYGLTPDWDVGVFVPFVSHESSGEFLLVPEDGSGAVKIGSADGRTEGVGDMMLLTKYRLAHGEDWSFSLGGRLKLPTGDEEEYLGTGKTDTRVQALLSKRFGDLETNLDLGYNWNGFGRDFDWFSYRAAVAYGLHEKLTLVGEIIGSRSQESIFDTLDAGVGIKVNPTGALVIHGGLRFPLDDDGLRSDVIPTVGVELRF